jgi:uncharacterized iron-regulated membrane protein
MAASFRSSMNWLHTWAGVVLGGLLSAIFWTGTLSVFDREIDRWMAPMTRLEMPHILPSLDLLRPFHDAAAEAGSPGWLVTLPTEREPVFRMTWRDGADTVVRLADPASGEKLPDPGTWAGTGFIYPFHYMLHLRVGQLGYWLVGIAAMAMLALCVTGVIVHRKIFAEFFVLRSDRRARRVILDLHNLAGVLGLPFHIAITLSGLVIFFSLYFPGVLQIAYQGDHKAYGAEAFGVFDRPKLGRPGPSVSLESMVGQARHLWEGRWPHYVFIRHVGDAAAFAQVARFDDASVGGRFGLAIFDAGSGTLLQHRDGMAPVMTVQRFISGLHLIQFRHWTLRWIYFGLGLVSWVVIATGFLFWLESRRRKHAQPAPGGVRVVDALTVGSVTGIVAATFAFFVANRLLPLGFAVAGYDRAALEIWCFYLVWLASFAHAWARPRRAWAEQCWTIAGLAGAAVLLNWITTGDHLARSLSHRHLWAVAGTDLLLILAGMLAAVVGRRC